MKTESFVPQVHAQVLLYCFERCWVCCPVVCATEGCSGLTRSKDRLQASMVFQSFHLTCTIFCSQKFNCEFSLTCFLGLYV